MKIKNVKLFMGRTSVRKNGENWTKNDGETYLQRNYEKRKIVVLENLGRLRRRDGR